VVGTLEELSYAISVVVIFGFFVNIVDAFTVKVDESIIWMFALETLITETLSSETFAFENV